MLFLKIASFLHLPSSCPKITRIKQPHTALISNTSSFLKYFCEVQISETWKAKVISENMKGENDSYSQETSCKSCQSASSSNLSLFSLCSFWQTLMHQKDCISRKIWRLENFESKLSRWITCFGKVFFENAWKLK